MPRIQAAVEEIQGRLVARRQVWICVNQIPGQCDIDIGRGNTDIHTLANLKHMRGFRNNPIIAPTVWRNDGAVWRSHCEWKMRILSQYIFLDTGLPDITLRSADLQRNAVAVYKRRRLAKTTNQQIVDIGIPEIQHANTDEKHPVCGFFWNMGKYCFFCHLGRRNKFVFMCTDADDCHYLLERHL